MGWTSGTPIMAAVIHAVKEHVEDDRSKDAILTKVLEAMRDADWDCESECLGIDPTFDLVLRRESPELFDDEDDEYDGRGDWLQAVS